MSTATARFFDEQFLRQLAQRANADAFVARHRTLADVRIGIRQSDTGDAVCIHVRPDALQIERTAHAPFTLAGDGPALQAMAEGTPFNRLVRQHRLQVQGDLRTCVQNWLLIFAVLRLCGDCRV